MPEPLDVEHAGQDLLAAIEALTHLEPPARARALMALPPPVAGRVFAQLDAPLQEELLHHLDDRQVQRLITDLDPDDRAHLLAELPEPTAQGLLARLSPRERRLTRMLLAFPEESAGRIMTPEFLALTPQMSAAQALDLVRQRGRTVETVYSLPVTDEAGRLLGMVELAALVLAGSEQRVQEVMASDVPTVHTDDHQERVARIIQAADLLAIPVVDAVRRVLGLVTVDDAMDVIQFEQAEDLARTGASEPLGRPYFSVSVLRLARSRIVWLLLLAVAATLTVNVLSLFEGILETVVSLSLFIPLLIGIGGNSGAQSATTVVRAMAVGEVGPADLRRVVLREAGVGVLLGSATAAIAYLPVRLFFGGTLAAVVSLTLVAVCALATTIGSTMPVLARRFGIDPAVVSAPVVTTLVDASGLLVYFLIARRLLGL